MHQVLPLHETPDKAPAGYLWERVPGRPGHWMMVLNTKDVCWQTAREETAKRWMTLPMRWDDGVAIA